MEKPKNSKAKIKATDRYNKKHYKNISIRVKPEEADYIRKVAKDSLQIKNYEIRCFLCLMCFKNCVLWVF